MLSLDTAQHTEVRGSLPCRSFFLWKNEGYIIHPQKVTVTASDQKLFMGVMGEARPKSFGYGEAGWKHGRLPSRETALKILAPFINSVLGPSQPLS